MQNSETKSLKPVPEDGLNLKSITKAFGFPQESTKINAKTVTQTSSSWWTMPSTKTADSINTGKVTRGKTETQEPKGVKTMISSLLNKDLSQQ